MARPSHSQGSGSEQLTGIYVYGIFPGDIEVTSDRTGVGDPPGQVRIVRSGDLAALVSDVNLSRPLGSPEDLRAHKDILDLSAAELPVLPMRFGAVLDSEDAVARELLDAHHDEFVGALEELDGRAEYVVKGRYVEEAILQEVLSESRQAALLREQIRGQDADATRGARIQLGELISEAITAKRAEDTRALGVRMAEHCVASLVRDPTHERDAVHVAFLLDTGQEKELDKVAEDLARTWDGRVELRVLGPMAAYDFAGTTEPGG
jgi:Gas vesicle synthesis protein GvpL/GvpF